MNGWYCIKSCHSWLSTLGLFSRLSSLFFFLLDLNPLLLFPPPFPVCICSSSSSFILSVCASPSFHLPASYPRPPSSFIPSTSSSFLFFFHPVLSLSPLVGIVFPAGGHFFLPCRIKESKRC